MYQLKSVWMVPNNIIDRPACKYHIPKGQKKSNDFFKKTFPPKKQMNDFYITTMKP